MIKESAGVPKPPSTEPQSTEHQNTKTPTPVNTLVQGLAYYSSSCSWVAVIPKQILRERGWIQHSEIPVAYSPKITSSNSPLTYIHPHSAGADPGGIC